MIDPKGDESEKAVGSRYSLVIAVAKRAKQLREGANKLVDCKSKNPITIALEEIAEGKVTLTTPTQEQMDAVGKSTVQMPETRPTARVTAELLRTSETNESASDEDMAEDYAEDTDTADADIVPLDMGLTEEGIPAQGVESEDTDLLEEAGDEAADLLAEDGVDAEGEESSDTSSEE